MYVYAFGVDKFKFVVEVITVTTHERHGVLNHRQRDHFFQVFQNVVPLIYQLPPFRKNTLGYWCFFLRWPSMVLWWIAKRKGAIIHTKEAAPVLKKIRDHSHDIYIWVQRNTWGIHDVIKWKYFPRYWPFVWGIRRSPANSPHKGQWHRALMFSVICAWKKKQLPMSKQPWGWRFETPSRSLWRHCNGRMLSQPCPHGQPGVIGTRSSAAAGWAKNMGLKLRLQRQYVNILILGPLIHLVPGSRYTKYTKWIMMGIRRAWMNVYL